MSSYVEDGNFPKSFFLSSILTCLARYARQAASLLNYWLILGAGRRDTFAELDSWYGEISINKKLSSACLYRRILGHIPQFIEKQG